MTTVRDAIGGQEVIDITPEGVFVKMPKTPLPAYAKDCDIRLHDRRRYFDDLDAVLPDSATPVWIGVEYENGTFGFLSGPL